MNPVYYNLAYSEICGCAHLEYTVIQEIYDHYIHNKLFNWIKFMTFLHVHVITKCVWHIHKKHFIFIIVFGLHVAITQCMFCISLCAHMLSSSRIDWVSSCIPVIVNVKGWGNFATSILHCVYFTRLTRQIIIVKNKLQFMPNLKNQITKSALS